MMQPPRRPLPVRPDEAPEDVPQAYPQPEAPGLPEPISYPDTSPAEEGPDAVEDLPPD